MMALDPIYRRLAMPLFIVNYANIIGMVGVVITLIAYYLLNINRLSSVDMRYLVMNFVGSSLVLISLLVYWNLSSVVIEASWALISLIGIYRVTRGHHKKKDNLKVFYNTDSLKD
jgi:hypothetical protein